MSIYLPEYGVAAILANSYSKEVPVNKSTTQASPRAGGSGTSFLANVKSILLRKLDVLKSVPGRIANLFRARRATENETQSASKQQMPETSKTTTLANPLDPASSSGTEDQGGDFPDRNDYSEGALSAMLGTPVTLEDVAEL